MIRFLMGFNTTDLPVNFNDRFRDIFRIGIFSGGDVEMNGPLSVGVTPFVAVTCDGGVVRDDVDTQTLAVPSNRPDGVYICLLAKYRDMDEPQLEWKVVEPSCLTTCDNSDCFIIFALVRTGAGFISSIEKYGPHRLDKCNKEDLHTWDTVASLPTIVDGLVRGECAFVIETKKFYWWDGTQWLPVNCGGRTIVVVTIVGGVVNVDASVGDVFICVLTGPTTFAAPTNPIDGKFIEYRIYSSSQVPLTWDPIFGGTQVTIPLITTAAGRGDADRVIFEYESAVGFSGAQWGATFRDTGNIAIGIGAQVQDQYANIAIGRGAVVGQVANSATAIGDGAGVGTASIYSTAIGSVIGDFTSSSVAIGGAVIGRGDSGSIAIGIGATIYDGAFNSLVMGSGSSSAAPHTIVIGTSNSVVDLSSVYSIVVGSGLTVDSGSEGAIVIGGTSQTLGAIPSVASGGAYDTVVVGNSNTMTSGVYASVAVGSDCSITGGANKSIAIGVNSVVYGNTTGVAIGLNTYVGRSPSFGGANYSIALGSDVGVDSGSSNSTVVGHRLSSGLNPNSYIEHGSTDSVVIGNGSFISEAAGSKILGNTSSISDNSVNSIALGDDIHIIQTSTSVFAAGHTINIGIGSSQAVVIGNQLSVGHATAVPHGVVVGTSITVGNTGDDACFDIIAVGYSLTVKSSQSIVIGVEGASIGKGASQSVAIGMLAQIADNCLNSVAIGVNAGIGTHCAITATHAVAIGDSSGVAGGSGGIALGYGASSAYNNSIAIGASSNAAGVANSIAIGAGASESGGGCTIGGSGTTSPAYFKVNTSISAGVGAVVIYAGYDADTGGSDPDVVGSAHKTAFKVRTNNTSLLKRVMVWPDNDMAGLIASYPSGKLLFVDG